MNHLILLTLLFSFSASHAVVELTVTGPKKPYDLFFIDGPDNDKNFTDNISVYKILDGGVISDLPEYEVENGQLIELEKNPGSDTLKIVKHDGKSYYSLRNSSGDLMLVSKQEIDMRGTNTGPRDKKNLLKESSSVFSPEGLDEVDASMVSCPEGARCPAKLPKGADLEVQGSQIVAGPKGYYNRLRVIDKTSGGMYLIDAADTSAAVDEKAYRKELCDNKDPIRDLLEQGTEIEEAAAEGANDDLLNAGVGACFRDISGSDAYMKKVAPKIKAVKGYTQEQLVSIDLLARTINAEMASCHRHAGEYLEAVGKVISNRKKFAETNPNSASEFVSSPIPPPESGGIFAAVAFKPLAFSVWNKGDRASDMAFCPMQKKNNPRVMAAYGKALEIARSMVMTPEKFQRKTKNIDALFYTSAIKPQNPSAYKEIKKPKIGEEILDRASCLRLWSSNQIKRFLENDIIKKWIFHPQQKSNQMVCQR